jgi:hypothetical protein
MCCAMAASYRMPRGRSVALCCLRQGSARSAVQHFLFATDAVTPSAVRTATVVGMQPLRARGVPRSRWWGSYEPR